MKYIKNTTQNNLNHYNSGVSFVANSTQVINEVRLSELNDSQLWNWFDLGYLVFNDGTQDYTNKYEGWHRFFNYSFGVPFLNDSIRSNGILATNLQEGLEEVRSQAFSKDSDGVQFGRNGNASSGVYLLTYNNIISYNSPNYFRHNVIFEGYSVSNSNECGSFKLSLWRANSDYSERTIIYEETFSESNSNFDKYSGYTIEDQSIVIPKGYGIYVQVNNVNNLKPKDINVILWIRKQ